MNFQEYILESIKSTNDMVNWNGQSSTLQKLIDDKKIVRKMMVQSDFNRTKFNRMNNSEQKEYQKKLKHGRKYFVASEEKNNEWSDYEVSKSLYDKLDLPEDEFKDKYKWIDDLGNNIA